LYQEVYYSINPETHTPGMHSWFPLYFPIKNPIVGRKGQTVRIQIWRNHSQTSVWYEWSMSLLTSSPEQLLIQTHIHNANGKGYSIGM